jgi:hypothetical protein
MAGAQPPKMGAGVVPPLSAPAAQAVKPVGDESVGREKMAKILGFMVDTLRHFSPGSKEFDWLSGTISSGSKHFRVDPDTAKKGQMPPMSPGAALPPGMPPPGGAPPMSGGPMQALSPRGPIPMPAA